MKDFLLLLMKKGNGDKLSVASGETEAIITNKKTPNWEFKKLTLETKRLKQTPQTDLPNKSKKQDKKGIKTKLATQPCGTNQEKSNRSNN